MSDITAEEVNKAITEVLSRRVYLPNVSPDSIGVQTVAAGQFVRFNLRLSRDYKVLPSLSRVVQAFEQSGKQGEGAKYLMLGSVQIYGDKLRVAVRIVGVETSIIKQAATGDGDSSYEGLCKAFELAMRSLNICYVA